MLYLILNSLLYPSFGLVLIHLVRNYWHLRHVPGPAVGSCTNLWRFFLVWGRRAERTHLELHKRHGDVVRLGPNCVSVSGPDMIPQIYGIGKGFVKSDFYKPLQNIVNGRRAASLVAETNESRHAAAKRPIAPAYSLSTLTDFEPLVDSTTAVFFSRLDALYAETGQACDVGRWLQFYAFDVIGELTFSKRLGFLEQGEDVEGIMRSIANNFDRCSLIGQMPWLDHILYKNPIYTRLIAKPVVSPIIKFGERRLSERVTPDIEAREVVPHTFKDPELESKELEKVNVSKPDLLSRFLAARENHPDIVTDLTLRAYLFMNINAGSDTVASTLRAAFYYLLKNPTSLSKLRSELVKSESENRFSSLPFVTYSETQDLPYLKSVVKEALRLHPALSLPLERVVPPSGLQLHDKNNTFLPPGTLVGINPWVLHRDARIFGEKPECWNPDRWLDADEFTARKMEQELLSFGAGKRSCLGKNIAMLEIHKIVAALLMRYDVSLMEPEKEWTLINGWLLRQDGLIVYLSRRGMDRDEGN